MARRGFDLVAFDGDDTLWHNERSYRRARERFRQILLSAGVDLTHEEIEEHVNRTEIRNIDYYGYGVSSFALSLIETAIALTGGRVLGGDLGGVIEVAKEMLSEEIELFDGARVAVTTMAATHPVMLITKGDLLHQTSKLERSGLKPSFNFVEVVSHKTSRVYASILERHNVEPDRFLMVGNSLRSDILPVVEIGARAIYVPAALSWAHEHAEVPHTARERMFELASLADLVDLVSVLESPAPSRRG